MNVIVSSKGSDVDTEISPVFGRAKYYLLVNTEDSSFESYENPAIDQSGGAGIHAAQFVLKKNPDAVISSSIGPNAYEVLTAASMSCYTAEEGSVREIVEAFNRGELNLMSAANAGSHNGMQEDSLHHSTKTAAGEEELEELSARLRSLRGQVAEILQQLDRLTEEQSR